MENSMMNLTDCLAAIQDAASKRGSLKCARVWRLHPNEVENFVKIHGNVLGGWAALAHLSVGTGILEAEEDSFVKGKRGWNTIDKPKVELVQSFTKYLIPPASGAGLFLALNVHPLWGLRLARRLHVQSDMLDGSAEGWKGETLFPDDSLDLLAETVSNCLNSVVDLMVKEGEFRVYDIRKDLCTIFEQCLEGGVEQETGDGLEVFFTDTMASTGKAGKRGVDFFMRGLVDNVLIPARVVTVEGDTHHVDCDTLKEVEII